MGLGLDGVGSKDIWQSGSRKKSPQPQSWWKMTYWVKADDPAKDGGDVEVERKIKRQHERNRGRE